VVSSPIWLPIFFSYFSTNEPELGAGIDPGMAFNPFPSSILDKMRQDSNPQPLDCELSPLSRPDLHPSMWYFSLKYCVVFSYANSTLDMFLSTPLLNNQLEFKSYLTVDIFAEL
jgi:hypothetical protein